MGYARLPLSAIHGEPSARALRSAGVDVRTVWRADRVEATGPDEFTVSGADETVESDGVVVALPHTRAAGVLPDGALEDPSRLERLGTSRS